MSAVRECKKEEEMDKRTKGLVAVGVLVIIAMIAVIIGIVSRKIGNIAGDENGRSTKSDMTLDELYADIDVSEATPVKGTVTLDTPDLYEELPEIDKYPLFLKKIKKTIENKKILLIIKIYNESIKQNL